MAAKPSELRWPLTPQGLEDVNAMFDDLYRGALAGVPASGGGGGAGGGGGSAQHNLLSHTHLDAVPEIAAVAGDLLYANATPKWDRLPIVAAGSVLLSGALPAWGKVANAHIATDAAIAWSKVDKTGSNLTDLATRLHSSLGSIGANDHHNQSHVLDGGDHTVSGLTAGHFLKALTAATFGFAAHGLSYGDVGAAAAGHNHTLDSLSNVTITSVQNADVVTWNAASGKWINAAGGGGGAHALLSATHTDTTAAAEVDGDLIIGSGGKWIRLANGAAGTFLQTGPAWGKIPAISSTYFTNLSGGNLTNVALLDAANHTFTGYGIHAFSAAGPGGNYLQVRNTTAGAGAVAAFNVGNDGTADAGGLAAFSTIFTPWAWMLADGVGLYSYRAGGLSIAATDGSGAIRFYAGGTVLTAEFPNNRDFKLPDVDLGAGWGRMMMIGRNSNAGNPGCGSLAFQTKDGSWYYLWVDVAGKVRVWTTPPSGSYDTSGTIVGTQS